MPLDLQICQKMSHQLRQKSDADLAERLAGSRWSPDARMQRMYRRDHSDFLYIADRLAEGRLIEAYEDACRLETAARDDIPQEIWKFMERNATLLSWAKDPKTQFLIQILQEKVQDYRSSPTPENSLEYRSAMQAKAAAVEDIIELLK